MYASLLGLPFALGRSDRSVGGWTVAVDYASLSAILSSVASVGKIIETTLALVSAGEEPDLLAVKKVAEEASQESIAKEDPKALADLAATIPQPILSAGEDAVKRIMEGIGKIFSAEMPIVEREQRLFAQQRELCHYLSELSRFGPLPDTLIAVWSSSKCAEKGFVLH